MDGKATTLPFISIFYLPPNRKARPRGTIRASRTYVLKSRTRPVPPNRHAAYIHARTAQPPKRRGEQHGHSIREGDGRELELGRGRGGGRRRGALPAGHVGGVAHAAPPTQHGLGLGEAAADGNFTR